MDNDNKDMVAIDDLEKRIKELTTIDQFSTPEEAVGAKAQIAAFREYATKRKAERKLIQTLNSGMVRIAWRIGGILKETLAHGRPSEKNEGVSLNEFGISRNQSMKYQTINDIPEDILEKRLCAKLDKDEDISESEFFKFAKAKGYMENENKTDDTEDGTDREEEERIIRDKVVELSKEQIAEIRKHEIDALENVSDEDLDLILRAIIESIMADNNQVKRKITKFVGENVLTYENYLAGLEIGIAQLRAIHKSMGVGSNQVKTPIAFLHFMNNLLKIIELFESWYPENMKVCEECKGTCMVQDKDGNPQKCDHCINGKVGWYKAN